LTPAAVGPGLIPAILKSMIYGTLKNALNTTLIKINHPALSALMNLRISSMRDVNYGAIFVRMN
jgi:hypothetical protein